MVCIEGALAATESYADGSRAHEERRLAGFLGAPFDVAAAANAVDPSLPGWASERSHGRPLAPTWQAQRGLECWFGRRGAIQLQVLGIHADVRFLDAVDERVALRRDASEVEDQLGASGETTSRKGVLVTPQCFSHFTRT
jgi:hypothetical protein